MATLRVCMLGIEGMTCSSCSGTVENALRSVPGVKLANVNLTTNTAQVEYQGDTLTTKELVDEVESVGFGAEVLSDVCGDFPASKLCKAILGIDGMTCSSCSGTVENAIRSIKGITESSVVVSLSTNTATFVLDTSVASLQTVVDEIEGVGFGVEILESGVVTEGSESDRKKGSLSITQDKAAIKTILLLIEGATTSVRSRATSTSDSAHGLTHARDVELGSMPHTEASIEWIAEQVRSLAGVQSVHVHAVDPQMKISYDDSLTGPRDFVAVANSAGCVGTVSSLGGFMMAHRLLASQEKESKKLYTQLTLAVALTVPIFCITMVLPMIASAKHWLRMEIAPGLAVNGVLLFLLSFPVQFYVGHQFHSKAWKTLKAGSLGMDFLVSTGTLAAYFYSTFGLVLGIVDGVANTRDVEYFETSAVLITAVLLGKYLEVYARGQTAAAIHKLSKLKAHTARLVRSGTTANAAATERGQSQDQEVEGDGEDEVIDASLLHRADMVRLVAGETVPADGQLLSGAHIGVDEAMMTGESALVSKAEKDAVFGGTMVVEGSALMRVTVCGDDSTLGRIISTVQQAQASKPPIQELADRVARYFVPAIAAISVLTFVTWMLAYAAGAVPPSWYAQAGNPFLFAFFFALAVWVSACPCAFGLATPTAVLVSSGVAAQHGILIRKGAALQHASSVNVVAFDKTGTLTKGSTEVTDFMFAPSGTGAFVPLPSASRSRDALSAEEGREAVYVLQLMLLAEKRSSHPLAKGITAFCQAQLAAMDIVHHGGTVSGRIPLEERLLFDVVPGLGLHMHTADAPAVPGSLSVLLGSGKLLESRKVTVPSAAALTASSYRAGGKVAVFLAVDGQLRAVLAVADAVRPEAAQVVRALHASGTACYMITGDEATTAQAIARAVGIPAERVLARAKPEEKKGFIEALQRSHLPGSRARRGGGAKLCVAFVGDGTNDSPALAGADVGITMASGSDIAVEAGDMVLCKNDLRALLIALDLSRQTMSRIRLNYFWALVYNAGLIPVAAGVLYPAYHFALAPMLAGAAMALSSVSIVLSSLLLVRYQPPHQALIADDTRSVGQKAATEMGPKCGCPASSVEDLVEEQQSILTNLWAALTGTQASPASSLGSSSKLLTPAEWRAAQRSGESEAYVLHMMGEDEEELDAALDSTLHGGEGGGVQAGGWAQLGGSWNPLRRSPGTGKKGTAAGYAPVSLGEGEGEDGYDVEESGAKGEGWKVGGKKPKGGVDLRRVKLGCGCGQGNCKCGVNCRCAESASSRR